MKTIPTILATLIIAFFTQVSSAQCLPDGITFTSQEQIDSFSFHYPGCTEIDGNVLIKGFGIKNFNGLKNLKYIDGDLKITSCYNLLKIDGFDSLKTIGGELRIIFNSGLTTVSGYNNLDTIGKGLFIQSTSNLTTLGGFHNVKSIGSDLHFAFIKISSIDGFENLNFIGGNLFISYCPNLINVDNFSNLKYVGKDFTISNDTSLTNLDGFNNIDTIFKSISIFDNNNLVRINTFNNPFHKLRYISIGNNPALTDLNGFSNIKDVTYGISISNNDKLTTLKGLHNIESIGGRVAISGNDSLINLSAFNDINTIGGGLSISGNKSLTNLNGFQNLYSIGGKMNISGNDTLSNINELGKLNSLWGGLFIWGNNKITNLDGLSSLVSIGGNLQISGNNSLSDISGIMNIDPTTIFSPPNYYLTILVITSNPNLSQCSVKPICDYLALDTNDIEIYNNAPGCNSYIEISANCLQISLSGHTFYDYNQNGKKDIQEGGIAGQSILFEPGETYLTDQNGTYFQTCDSGTIYTINWIPDSNWNLTTDSSSYTVNFEPNNPENPKKDFGLFPTFSTHDGLINLSSLPARCNDIIPFFLNAKNIGTFIENGQVQLQYDSTVFFISALPLPDEIDISNHTLIWNYDSLYPYKEKDFAIDFQMPNQNNTGEPIDFVAKLYGSDSNLLAEYSYTPTVLCSFDPNDKIVMPSGEKKGHYTQHDQKLTYTIRFQNTGNAEAIDITIKDTIDTDLDISTLRIVNSSFPVQTSIKGQAVEFYFRNIWLPDSTSNEAQSHGFATYEIRPKADLADYTEIENTAYILFDFNDAIVTNTTTNTMVTVIPVALNELEKLDISIHPNPADDVIYISAKGNKPIDKVMIYNTLGELVLAQKGSRVDVGHLPKGMYFVHVEIGKKRRIKKLIIE